MTSAGRPSPHTVIYDPDAVVELLAVKSKEEHRALLNAVLKLREVGEQLGPPHMKPLKGTAGQRCASCVHGRGKATGGPSIAGRARST